MDRKVKVFVSIPNTGWVRHELAWQILPMIKADEEHEAFVEPLSFSCDGDKYIFSNRNRIVRRFLVTPNDYLLMIDADTVPLFNPLDLVDFGCDIIAAPAKIIEPPNTTWSAWHLEDGKKIEIDIEKEADAVSPANVVGSGCIAIKRSVLEKIRSPFTVEVNIDGILSAGADFCFCQKARKAGFGIWTTTKLISEHYKEVPLYFAKKWGAIL